MNRESQINEFKYYLRKMQNKYPEQKLRYYGVEVKFDEVFNL